MVLYTQKIFKMKHKSHYNSKCKPLKFHSVIINYTILGDIFCVFPEFFYFTQLKTIHIFSQYLNFYNVPHMTYSVGKQRDDIGRITFFALFILFYYSYLRNLAY